MNTELQSFTSDRIYCAVDLAEQRPGDIDILNLGRQSFYLKDEVDAVIAALEKKLDIYKRGWMENDKINANQCAEISHHKYKRCLAMANVCSEKLYRPNLTTYWYEFYSKWLRRWLKLANKFKEAK